MTGAERRRRWTTDEREQILAAANAPGAVVADVGRRWDICTRALRGIALGRKSWLFAGSDRGGERAAVMYSLIVTCLCRARHKRGLCRPPNYAERVGFSPDFSLTGV